MPACISFFFFFFFFFEKNVASYSLHSIEKHELSNTSETAWCLTPKKKKKKTAYTEWLRKQLPLIQQILDPANSEEGVPVELSENDLVSKFPEHTPIRCQVG